MPLLGRFSSWAFKPIYLGRVDNRQMALALTRGPARPPFPNNTCGRPGIVRCLFSVLRVRVGRRRVAQEIWRVV